MGEPRRHLREVTSRETLGLRSALTFVVLNVQNY